MTVYTPPTLLASSRAGTRRRGGRQPSGGLAVVQSALAAEHAAVYGYGVVGARLDGKRREQARSALEAHRAQRDLWERTARDLGGRPEPAAPAYTLPFTVLDAASAVRLAIELETRVAMVYADAVRELRGTLRVEAAQGLRGAAVRAVGWRGDSIAFPGLRESADPASASAAPDAF